MPLALQLRVVFEIDASTLDEALVHALKEKALPRGTFETEVVRKMSMLGINESGSVDEQWRHSAPSVFFQRREFLTRRYVKKNGLSSVDIVRKSLSPRSEERYDITRTRSIRALTKLDGIRLESIDNGVRITRVVRQERTPLLHLHNLFSPKLSYPNHR